MPTLAILAQLQARPGREADAEAFLTQALPLAQQEADTRHWFALRRGPARLAIFDTFDTEAGRQAHLDGPIARGLGEVAEALFETVDLQTIEILAAK